FIISSINIFNKLYLGLRISEIIRWATYIDEIKLRELDLENKSNTLKLLKKLYENYDEIIQNLKKLIL
ncbi:hypothetical protein KA977_11680, partial [Candidatus Dependentiae bacterium]|nr:hypothetical protein [Candidatus Dependentiae bacterium]